RSISAAALPRKRGAAWMGGPSCDVRLVPRSLRRRRHQADRQRTATDAPDGWVALAADVHGYCTGLAVVAADLDLGRRLSVGLGVLDDRAAGIRAELGAGPRIDHEHVATAGGTDQVEPVWVLSAVRVRAGRGLAGRRDRRAVWVDVLHAGALAVLAGAGVGRGRRIRPRGPGDRLLRRTDRVADAAE